MSEKLKQLAKIADNLGVAALGIVATRTFLLISEDQNLIHLIPSIAAAIIFYILMQLIAIKLLDVVDSKPKSASPVYTVRKPPQAGE